VSALRFALLMGLAGLMAACTHVAGMVQRTDGRPLSTAVFSIGRPSDIVAYGEHPVDENGRFDFYIGPADENNLYVYDRAKGATETLQQVPMDQINDHMVVKMVQTNSDVDPSLKVVP
jgi:hypothetical protein